MKISARTLLSSTALVLGAGMLLMNLFVISPTPAFADDSVATSTDSSDMSVATTTDPSTMASSTDTSTSTTASSTTPDTTHPVLTLAFAVPITDPTGMNPIPVTATFSEPVTGFQASSLNIGAGHVENFVEVSPTQYTFNVVVTVPEGTVSVDSNDGNVKDAAGNIALAATQINVRFKEGLANMGGGSTSTTTATSTSGTGNGGSTSTTTPPYVLITDGPADGSTISTSTATFSFVNDAMSSIMCEFGTATTTSVCTSPVTYSNLVDGVYPFSVIATYNSMTATSSRTFTVDLEAASSTTTTTGSGSTSTGGGVSGQSIGGGTSGSSISGSGTSGSTSGSGASGSTTTTGTTGGSTSTGTGTGSNLGGSTVSGGSAFIGTTGEVSTTSTSTDDLGAPAYTTPTSTQAAGAAFAGMSATMLWSLFALLLLLIIAACIYWYYRRNRETTN